MSWIYLLVAGLFETGWATGLKYSEGLSKFWPTLFTIISMIIGYFGRHCATNFSHVVPPVSYVIVPV